MIMKVALESMDKLVEEKEALRADLEAVAVALNGALKEMLSVAGEDCWCESGDLRGTGFGDVQCDACRTREALARPGVQAVLEGVKDG